MNHEQLKREKVIEILKEWASTQENWKYHFNWIEKLNKDASDEELFNDYKQNAPNNCLEQTIKRISYLLIK